MFEKLRIRNSISIEVLPAIEAYQSESPIVSPSEQIIESKNEAIKHGVNHILWFLFHHKITCGYCKTSIKYWDQTPKVRLFVRNVVLYKDVPNGAKDQRIILHKGWVAHITYSGIEVDCPKCGLRLKFNNGGWGLIKPMFGSSTTDYLIDSGSGFKRLAPTVTTDRHGHSYK